MLWRRSSLTRKRRGADGEPGALRIGNARPVERVANAERRAEELIARVDRLAGEPARLGERREGAKADAVPNKAS